MRLLIAATIVAVQMAASGRPADIPFDTQRIDPGASESAAVADINRDGRLDIISGEYWYQAPTWPKHKFREVGFASNYLDSFSVLPVDVDGDGYPDIVDVTWFARKVAWWKNPGKAKPGTLWTAADVNACCNVEFAVLADMDNDGKVQEVLAQENGTGQSWYEARAGAWVKHVVSDRSYGHGIGYGDVNGDRRNDILTPRGWLEAPADPRAGAWIFHADWEALNVPIAPAGSTLPPAPAPPPGAPPPGPRLLELGFMHVVDVNGDGRNDVLAGAAHDFGVFWFEQRDKGQWMRRTIDSAWSQAHASTLIDLNRDGRPDLVTGKRFMAHNGSDPGERDPLGLYWYEHRPTPPAKPGAPAGVEWIRHVIEYGGRVGAGMQIPVIDIDGDGDLDLVSPGKSGLHLLVNRSKP
jgi:hypothetical protein